MAGPIIVVFASIATYMIAQRTNSDLVTDDYYKEGKYINIVLERDTEAQKRNIHAQVLISPNYDAAKIFLTGDFDRTQPLDLQLIHPARQALDQKVRLQPTPGGSAVKPNIPPSSNRCRVPSIGMFNWKMPAAYGGWKINGLLAKAMP